MKVTVFGASGKVGRLVVDELLEHEHIVTVFVHSSPFKETNKLKVVKGDVHSLSDVKSATKESEIVISTLGSWGTKQKDIVSSGIANIIEALHYSNNIRVVSLTGSDATASTDKHSFMARIFRMIINISPARKVFEDAEKHISMLESSDLDWTVIRAPVMNNRGDSSDFRLGNTKPKLWATISRASVAKAIVNQVEDKTFLKQAPYIIRGRD